jgi:hypothetical protein
MNFKQIIRILKNEREYIRDIADQNKGCSDTSDIDEAIEFLEELELKK